MRIKKLISKSVIIHAAIGVLILIPHLGFTQQQPNLGFKNKNFVWGKEGEKTQITLPTATLELYAPFAIEEAGSYKDGGTIYIKIKDSRGTNFRFCADGRMSMGTLNESSPLCLYIGVFYPEQAGAQKLAIGGKEEQSILNFLQGWADAHILKQKQKAIFSNFAECIQEDPLGLGKDAPDNCSACRVLSVIAFLRDKEYR